jgi:hypothetical protein
VTVLQLPDLASFVDGVPTASLPEVIGAFEAAKARAWARLMLVSPAAPAPDNDATVDVREAARLLGMSPT